MIDRMALVLSALIVNALLTTCNERAKTSGDEIELPLPGVLAAAAPDELDVLRDGTYTVAGAWYKYVGGEAYWKWECVALHGNESQSYAVYQIGPLVPGDRIDRLAVELVAGDVDVTSGSRSSCEVLVPDFDLDQWRAIAKISDSLETDDDREIQCVSSVGQEIKTVQTELRLPQAATYINSNGLAFIAIRVLAGSHVRIRRLQLQLDLVNGEFDHFRGDIPPMEVVNYPVALKLAALDANERVIGAFNESAELSWNRRDIAADERIDFHSGWSTAAVVFGNTGEYKLRIRRSGNSEWQSLPPILCYQTKLPVYQIFLSAETLDFLHANPFDEEYHPASVIVDGFRFSDAVLRYRGRHCRLFPKKAWKIKLNGEQQYADPDWGYDRKIINLSPTYCDPTLLRNQLGYEIFRDLGVIAPRTRFVHLRINDCFAGLYTEVENPRREWLSAMGVSDGGALYKACENAALHVRSCAEDYQGCFEKKLRESEPFDDLHVFCRELSCIDNSNGTDPAHRLAELVDLEQFTGFLVGSSLLSCYDNWVHNYYLYHDETGTGKWLIIPWDLDFTWGHVNRYDTIEKRSAPRIRTTQTMDFGSEKNLISIAYFRSPALRGEFKEEVQSALTDLFTEEAIGARIDQSVALIHDDVLADQWRFCQDSDYEWHVDELKNYVRERRNYLFESLSKFD